MAITQQSNELLNSWKEISNYVGRGVRTVQRWERDFGLPVRRPGGHVRGSVIAMRREIDEWLSSRSARQAVEGKRETRIKSAQSIQTHTSLSDLGNNMEEFKARYYALLAENRDLRANLARSLDIVRTLREELRHATGKSARLPGAAMGPELNAPNLPLEPSAA